MKQPLYGGFGLIAAEGIKKPSYNAYALLHLLGHQRIPNSVPATARSPSEWINSCANSLKPALLGTRSQNAWIRSPQAVIAIHSAASRSGGSYWPISLSPRPRVADPSLAARIITVINTERKRFGFPDKPIHSK